MRADHNTRKCQTCAVDKPLDQFQRIRGNPDGRSIICKECIELANRESSAPERAPKSRESKRAGLYGRYGITHKQYLEILRQQGGTCAICHKVEPNKNLSIDHDHRCCTQGSSCGKCVRGLLCSRCNIGISLLSDSSDHLENAIDYLEGNDRMKAEQRRSAKRAKKHKQRKALPYLTIPEKERFFKAIDSARDRAIFRLLYHHGLRASEIGKLELADYRPGSTTELDRIKITRLKGSISGECTVVPAAAIAVRSWLRKRGTRAGALFPSRFRTPISRKRIWALMKRYCTRAGIPAEKAHPHCLKHTCCTHLISDQREDIMAVRSHVGHVNVRNTLIYAEMMDEATEARAKRLRNWK